jgi:hypothetical protein
MRSRSCVANALETLPSFPRARDRSFVRSTRTPPSNGGGTGSNPVWALERYTLHSAQSRSLDLEGPPWAGGQRPRARHHWSRQPQDRERKRLDWRSWARATTTETSGFVSHLDCDEGRGDVRDSGFGRHWPGSGRWPGRWPGRWSGRVAGRGLALDPRARRHTRGRRKPLSSFQPSIRLSFDRVGLRRAGLGL